MKCTFLEICSKLSFLFLTTIHKKWTHDFSGSCCNLGFPKDTPTKFFLGFFKHSWEGGFKTIIPLWEGEYGYLLKQHNVFITRPPLFQQQGIKHILGANKASHHPSYQQLLPQEAQSLLQVVHSLNQFTLFLHRKLRMCSHQQEWCPSKWYHRSVDGTC